MYIIIYSLSLIVIPIGYVVRIIIIKNLLSNSFIPKTIFFCLIYIIIIPLNHQLFHICLYISSFSFFFVVYFLIHFLLHCTHPLLVNVISNFCFGLSCIIFIILNLRVYKNCPRPTVHQTPFANPKDYPQSLPPKKKPKNP